MCVSSTPSQIHLLESWILMWWQGDGRRWGFWVVIRSWWASLMNGVSALIEQTTESSLDPSTTWGCREKQPSMNQAFPVLVYESESWIIKKAEWWRIDAFRLWHWRRLESPLGSKEIKSGNPKRNQPKKKKKKKERKKEITPDYSLEGLVLKLRYFGHLMWRADSLEKTLILGKFEGKMRKQQQRMGC